MGKRDTNNPIKNRRKIKKQKARRRNTFFVIILLGYLAYHYVDLQMQYDNLLEEKERLSKEVQEIQVYQEQLREEVEKSKSKKYIETLARKYFGLVYPDEKVYMETKVEEEDKEE